MKKANQKMLIEKLFIPKEALDEVGLDAVEMGRLGNVVALTGKNGSGKTRFLDQLIAHIQVRNAVNVENLRNAIRGYGQNIENHPGHPSRVEWEKALEHAREQLSFVTERVISAIDPSTKIGVLRFVPKQLTLTDPRAMTKIQVQGQFESAKNAGIDAFEQRCLPYIQKSQDRMFEATHQSSQLAPEEISEEEQRFSELNSLIHRFLKTNVTRSINSDAEMFGKPLAEAGLSEGQKVLVQLVVALHAQKGKLNQTVFIMDEPENHLHPSALIEFFSKLEEVAEGSQFWVATHSIPLLAHFANKDPMSIWYIEDGKISNAGSKPEKVLRGLLGDDEQVGQLNAFTSLPAQYAALNFATECLTEPKVIGGGSGDPQVNQVGGLIDFNATSPISLLDYGAGKGRLLVGLNEMASSMAKSLPAVLDYYAFDHFTNNKEAGLTAIGSIYDDPGNRYFESREQFFSSKNDGSIDVVVMCNVLHEISPSNWMSLFNHQSLIWRALKDEGYLLIVEDQRIPVGELAHEYGFLILDTPHLRTLFGVSEDDSKQDSFQVFDHRNDGRLKAHKISKSLIGNMTDSSRRSAIEELRETAKDQIKALRKMPPNYRNGQLHGFWSQQFANASIWLDQ